MWDLLAPTLHPSPLSLSRENERQTESDRHSKQASNVSGVADPGSITRRSRGDRVVTKVWSSLRCRQGPLGGGLERVELGEGLSITHGLSGSFCV